MSGYRKLGRSSAHRQMMLRNMTADLLRNGSIITTHAKAKEIQRSVEKMISLGKRGDLHAQRAGHAAQVRVCAGDGLAGQALARHLDDVQVRVLQGQPQELAARVTGATEDGDAQRLHARRSWT